MRKFDNSMGELAGSQERPAELNKLFPARCKNIASAAHVIAKIPPMEFQNLQYLYCESQDSAGENPTIILWMSYLNAVAKGNSDQNNCTGITSRILGFTVYSQEEIMRKEEFNQSQQWIGV